MRKIIQSDGQILKINKSRRGYASKLIAVIALCVLSMIFVFPVVYMFFMSFMGNIESLGSAHLFPQRTWYMSNYLKVFDAQFLRWLFNTLIIILCNLVLIPLACSFCAFGFSRCEFRGKEICFALVLATTMLPVMAVQIPLYIIYYNLRWLNTLFPFVVPGIFGGGAMNIFLTRQFMRSLPNSLDEAATIDGASRFKVYFSIYLPLCAPILVFVMIGVFNSTWNDFMGPLMYLDKEESFTLALGIYKRCLSGPSDGMYPNLKMAIGTVMLIPSMVVFFIFQKQLIDGVTIGSVKG